MLKKTLESAPDKLQNVYCNKVRVGNWFEDAQLEDYRWSLDLSQMRKGNLMLAKYRMMTKTVNKPIIMSQCTGRVKFGDTVGILAPHVPASDPPVEGKNGLLMQCQITSNDILYQTDLVNECRIVLSANLSPMVKNAFNISSADYCDRRDEPLKYNQEFMLTLASSVDKKPLYIRYDMDAIPGLKGMYPLYLSENAVSNCRWRVLPVRRPDITRFELEDQEISVNSDVVINHCATNVNLGVNLGLWIAGFYSKLGLPLMRTCLNIYGKEKPNNIWQIYTPIQDK